MAASRWKLIVSRTKVFEGSLIELIDLMAKEDLTGRQIAIYRFARTRWILEAGGQK